MKALLDKIGSTFFVASFIPAAGFIIIVSIVFGPVMPRRIVQFQMSGEVQPMNLSFLALLALAVILGFTLSSLAPFTFKVFQGYYFLDHVAWLKKRQHKKAEQLRLKAQHCKKRADELFLQLEEVRKKRGAQDQIEELQHLIAIERKHQRQFDIDCSRAFPPISPSTIMSTELGNIIRAAEAYPATQYGIDKVTMWPRLLHVISEGYYSQLEQSENILYFTINSALLTLFAALLSLLTSLVQFGLYYYLRSFGVNSASFLGPNSPNVDIYAQRGFQYLIAFFAALLVFYALYRIATLNSEMYAALVRGAFDLFRHDLLAQLKMPLPPDDVREFQIWTVLSGFFALAQYDDPPIDGGSKFKYVYRSSDDDGDKDGPQTNSWP